MDNWDLLTDSLKEFHITLTNEQFHQFQNYYELMIEWNSFMNLTAITEMDEVIMKHFVDSVSLIQAVPDLAKKGYSLIDIGTGAGFPGLPLRVLEPSIRLTLLDSLNKRIQFLETVCRELDLPDVACVHARAEEFAAEHRETFDLAVSRAVAALPVLCELCLPYVKVGGLFLAMKSTDSGQELEDAAHCIKLLGGRVEEPFDYVIPGAGVTHRVIPIRKVAPTLKGYPRRWAKIQKAPL